MKNHEKTCQLYEEYKFKLNMEVINIIFVIFTFVISCFINNRYLYLAIINDIVKEVLSKNKI